MSIDCEKARAIVSVILGQLADGVTVAAGDYDGAFQHLKRCAACRNALTPQEHARFVSTVVLARE